MKVVDHSGESEGSRLRRKRVIRITRVLCCGPLVFVTGNDKTVVHSTQEENTLKTYYSVQIGNHKEYWRLTDPHLTELFRTEGGRTPISELTLAERERPKLRYHAGVSRSCADSAFT